MHDAVEKPAGTGFADEPSGRWIALADRMTQIRTEDRTSLFRPSLPPDDPGYLLETYTEALAGT